MDNHKSFEFEYDAINTIFFEGKEAINIQIYHCSYVRFASFLSGGFITAIVVNPPESKLAKRTSVHWLKKLKHFKKY